MCECAPICPNASDSYYFDIQNEDGKLKLHSEHTYKISASPITQAAEGLGRQSILHCDLCIKLPIGLCHLFTLFKNEAILKIPACNSSSRGHSWGLHLQFKCG
ncbi:hypothetical protein CEXT_521541 [Caerostris extrusa]|uniref:Uncharacterized protein n=1 Tax=Caerostris extrusa TaxID=172846 RepID=A0AAV4Y5Z0_CAEEX|nr:hypothetical protein CEXT_521541 [Caerostris extrusa]